MKVNELPPFQSFPSHTPPRPSTSTYQEVSAFNHDNSISITTKEGDTINISQTLANVSEVSKNHEITANGSLQNFTAASLNYENLTFQVEGDLSQEELADVKKLFKELFDIAGDFFSGNIAEAFSGVGNLTEHMGSISTVEASFSRSSVVSAYSRNYHPLTNFPDSVFETIGESEGVKSDKNSVKHILQAQWHQIASMLEKHNALLVDDNQEDQPSPAMVETVESPTMAPTNAPTNSIQSEPPYLEEQENTHAKKMINTITDVMNKHPRLSPFAIPIADLAIDSAVEESTNKTQAQHLTVAMKNAFIKQFDEWFFG